MPPRPTDVPVPPEARERGEVIVEHSAIWQGPLPPPAILEQFRQIVPDAPERIFRQWEAESDHRRSYEKSALAGEQSKIRRGQWFAFIFALAGLAVAGAAFYLGYPTGAGVIAGTTIVSVVGAFLFERRKQG